MEINLKTILRELGIALLLSIISWFLLGDFGTVFVLTLLIRYHLKDNKDDRVVLKQRKIDNK